MFGQLALNIDEILSCWFNSISIDRIGLRKNHFNADCKLRCWCMLSSPPKNYLIAHDFLLRISAPRRLKLNNIQYLKECHAERFLPLKASINFLKDFTRKKRNRM